MILSTEDINDVKMIRDDLVLHLGIFSDCTPVQKMRFLKKLKHFIDSHYQNSGISNYILNDKTIKKKLPALRKLCLVYEKNLEKQYVKACLGRNCSGLFSYVWAYEKFLKAEGALVGLTKSSKIIVLGSGYLPGTALLLAKIFKAKCLCIDHDKQAVANSKKLIKKLSLEKLISIKYGDATKFPLAGFDIIYVTGSCIPKKDIFEHILDEIEDARIIYRNPLGLYNMFYTPSTCDEINRFKVLKNIHHGKGYPFDSVLLTTKDAKL